MSEEQHHVYEYLFDIDTPNYAPAKVVRMVGANKRVLEIGAGPGSIARVLKKNNCRVTGVEIDESAIKILSGFCEKVYQCDLNSPDWASQLVDCGTFDVVVAADVFEHLYKPQHCLMQIKRFLSPGGYLVVSLPYVGNNAVIASLLDSDFDYHDFGLLDRTHIRFFGLKNMQGLFENVGYKILSAELTVFPPGLNELASHWRKLSPWMKAALRTNKFGTVYQVVMKVVPTEFSGTGIQLANLTVPRYPGLYKKIAKSWIIKARSWIVNHTSPEARQIIKQLLMIKK